jgi:hypothetical protein
MMPSGSAATERLIAQPECTTRANRSPRKKPRVGPQRCERRGVWTSDDLSC